MKGHFRSSFAPRWTRFAVRSLIVGAGVILLGGPALHAAAPRTPANGATVPVPSPAAATAPAATSGDPESLAAALSVATWGQVEKSLDRALAWLAKQQKRNGSFEAPDNAQPATTSLVIMAFLSKGHLPGEGPYGTILDAGIDYVLQCQKGNGLLARAGATDTATGKTANYNHAISGLMLTEAYGMTDRARAAKLKPAILRALDFTRSNQAIQKSDPGDQGGWRYLSENGLDDSDLSVTSWQLMFLRSARNAEFDVPKPFIDEAVAYVLRCWDENQGVFYYKKAGNESRWSRGMVGAGILSLALSGQHDTAIAQRAGDWLVNRPFRSFAEQVGNGDRFFYSAYYCSQAMAQLGGRHWRQFFPGLVNVLLRSQQASGEWPVEPHGADHVFGNTYTTAMAVLSLTPPLQLLPVYQR